MCSPLLPRPAVRDILKAVFWNWWSGLLIALYGLYGVLQTIDSQSSRFPAWLKTIWDQWYVMPDISRATFLSATFALVACLAVVGTYRFASGYYQQYENLTAHNVVPNILLRDSNVYYSLFSPWQCPKIHASVGIRFKNKSSHDIDLTAIKLRVYGRERKNKIIEFPLRGRDSETVRRQPLMLNEWRNPEHEIEIAGLTIKAGQYSPKYFFMDREMLIADAYGNQLVNGTHFLRLTVETVGQRPYDVDLEVDWTSPGRWVLSAKPATGSEKVITIEEYMKLFTAGPKPKLKERVVKRLKKKRERKSSLP